MKTTILMDTAEKSPPPLPEWVTLPSPSSGVQQTVRVLVKPQKLPSADFALGPFGIERKASWDEVCSCLFGRKPLLLDGPKRRGQLSRLAEDYERRLLLLEDDLYATRTLRSGVPIRRVRTRLLQELAAHGCELLCVPGYGRRSRDAVGSAVAELLITDHLARRHA